MYWSDFIIFILQKDPSDYAVNNRLDHSVTEDQKQSSRSSKIIPKKEYIELCKILTVEKEKHREI